MINPVVSIVTICYNAKAEIEKTILSVLSQTYSNLEYIIIDGGSTDGTVDVVKKYSGKIDYWVSEPDKGIYDAMNKGIEKATGQWLNFMNAGDVFYSENTVSSVFCDRELYSTHVVYGDCILDNCGKMLYQKASSVFRLDYQMICCHQSAFVTNVGLKFRVDLRIASDYVLFLTYRKQFGRNSFLYLNMPVSIFDASGISNQNKKMLRKEYSLIYAENKHYYYYYDLIKRKVKLLLCRI